MKLADGEYIVKCHSELDNGYGIEAASDEVYIYIDKGEVDEVIACGLHDVTEYEVDWNPDLTDEECFELIRSQGVKRG